MDTVISQKSEDLIFTFECDLSEIINNFLKYKALCQKCKHDEYFAKCELYCVMGMLLLTP
jgi:hypothetical protein